VSSGSSSSAPVAAHLRRLRLRAVRDRLRESLLFLPALMLLASVAVALVLGEIDSRHLSRPLPWTFGFAPGTASTLLGIIAGATITTAGVVFSLLVVSLQLASGQFSPRVLRGSGGISSVRSWSGCCCPRSRSACWPWPGWIRIPNRRRR
jgi:uncharacterized membrane protein